MEDKEQKTSGNSDTYQWKLGEDLTIYAIESLKESISQELDLHEQFDLDLSQIEEIDSAGIQLLLALRSELFRKDKVFKIIAMSPVVTKMIASYELNERLSVSENADAV